MCQPNFTLWDFSPNLGKITLKWPRYYLKIKSFNKNFPKSFFIEDYRNNWVLNA